MRVVFFLVLVLLLLTLAVGCATYSQLFVNASGQMMHCSATGQGIIGMATASNAVNDCKAQMRAAGYIEIERAGVIGVFLSESAAGTPVRILRVTDASPAQAAGILPGDVIVKIAGQSVESPKDAQVLLFGEAGTNVELVIRRGDQETSYTLERAPYTKVFGQLPAAKPAHTRETPQRY